MQKTSILLHQVIKDAAECCSTEVLEKDLKVIDHRILHEGLSFVTITLPNFLEDFQTALKEGRVSSNLFVGWTKRRCLPAFLQGFTKLVFSDDGVLRDEPQISAIRSIRQICSTFKKVKLDCTARRTNKALQSYCQIDNEVGYNFNSVSKDDLARFKEVSRLVWGSIFGRMMEEENLLPHHGPGSTAEALTGNKKYIAGSFTWPERLTSVFNPSELLFGNDLNHFESDVSVPMLEEHDELPVRVITVPKTLKKPRIIALEPVAMQMSQQAIKDYIVRKLESHPLTAGHLNFSDQAINRELALTSSKDGKFATLDLSAASDRVHKDLVWAMLEVNPGLRDLVFMTRSRKSKVTVAGETHELLLNKFASMGSALCFPIEAMVFFTLLIMADLEHSNTPSTLSSINTATKRIYVYGDDIIIPVNKVDTAIRTLSLYGNVVGLDKSYWTGKFRESCGMDAYDGKDITPTYIRSPLPGSRRDHKGVVSLVATANLFYQRGFIRTAYYLKKQIESHLGQKLPEVATTSSGLGWHFPACEGRKRYNCQLQRIEVRTLAVSPVFEKDRIDGYNALAKCLLKLQLGNRIQKYASWESARELYDQAAQLDKHHLSRSPRFGALVLKHRWVAA